MVTESLKKVFKSRIPSINYIFPNGKPAIFVFGKYITDNEEEIAHLTKEIKDGHPHLYIDDNETEVQAPASGNELIAGIRAQLRAELIAEMAKATNPANDMGNSTAEPLKPANSQDVAQAAAGGSAGVGLVSLATLKAAAASGSK